MRVNELMAKIIYGDEWRYFYSPSEIQEDDMKEREREQVLKILDNAGLELNGLLNKNYEI